MFKLAPIYVEKVFALAQPPFRNVARLLGIKESSKTVRPHVSTSSVLTSQTWLTSIQPPYLTATAETRYHRIPSEGEAFMIITSDGLDNPDHPPSKTSVHPQEDNWVSHLGELVDRGETMNLAVKLLRSLWGRGEEGRHRASAFLNLDYKHDHYQDDTTIIVVVLD